jgi:hypothetical protein
MFSLASIASSAAPERLPPPRNHFPRREKPRAPTKVCGVSQKASTNANPILSPCFERAARRGADMSAAKILDRLEAVKQTGPGRWLARCSAHADKSPSLTIRETDHGMTLIHCFAGCEPDEVLAAVGLTMSDLFPERSPRHSYPASHSSIPARDLLVILDHELTVVALILNDIVTRRTASESQRQRLCRAAARIGKARDVANPAKGSRRAA